MFLLSRVLSYKHHVFSCLKLHDSVNNLLHPIKLNRGGGWLVPGEGRMSARGGDDNCLGCMMLILTHNW